MKRFLVGDLGSSVVRLATAVGHSVSEIEKVPAPSGEGLWEELVGEVRRYAEGKNLIGIKLAIAGAVDGGQVSSPKSNASFPLGSILRERMGLPIRLCNDLYAVALGELSEGAAKDVQNGLVITVSTGIAAVVIKRGALLPTPHHLSEEFGHLPVPPERIDSRVQLAPDACGHRPLCYNRYASGLAIYERARQLGLEVTPERGREFDEAAERGDEIATGLYRDEGRLLAEWLAEIMKKYEVETVVMQGTFARRGFRFFGEHLEERLRELGQPVPDFRVGALGDDAGLIGATYLPDPNE